MRGGDTDTYAVLVRRYAADARRAAVVAGVGADAEDITQAAFVKAYQNLTRFRDGAAFRPWLLRIVVNEARNAIRADRRRRAAAERLAWLGGVPADDGDPADVAVHDDTRSVLRAALRELPETQRQVVVCRYILDLDEQESATVLGWPRGTVKSRLHRALRQLRARLDGEEPAEREAEHGR
ncbi:RNA polymerase sigma factor [Phytoactinopolyspora halotolerans]|uniref:RNA polymerase sigma factor n=1 Tax=Phytoactinopolyspora halotolerans TaxID=1981512 RepID=UPI001C2080CA|nr:RNA polymerase sigma factor [Phytoactinopolyspora halotolerans]